MKYTSAYSWFYSSQRTESVAWSPHVWTLTVESFSMSSSDTPSEASPISWDKAVQRDEVQLTQTQLQTQLYHTSTSTITKAILQNCVKLYKSSGTKVESLPGKTLQIPYQPAWAHDPAAHGNNLYWMKRKWRKWHQPCHAALETLDGSSCTAPSHSKTRCTNQSGTHGSGECMGVEAWRMYWVHWKTRKARLARKSLAESRPAAGRSWKPVFSRRRRSHGGNESS